MSLWYSGIIFVSYTGDTQVQIQQSFWFLIFFVTEFSKFSENILKKNPVATTLEDTGVWHFLNRASELALGFKQSPAKSHQDKQLDHKINILQVPITELEWVYLVFSIPIAKYQTLVLWNNLAFYSIIFKHNSSQVKLLQPKVN